MFLNKADLLAEDLTEEYAEMLELVEMELRELLDTYEFPGDDTPIIAGSALMALNGKDDNELGKPMLRSWLKLWIPTSQSQSVLSISHSCCQSKTYSPSLVVVL